jgi:hypothetical protein
MNAKNVSSNLRTPLILGFALALAGCQSASNRQAASDAASKPAADPSKNIARLERQLHIATERAGVARAQEQAQGAASALAVARVESELKDLTDQLAQLEQFDMPARVAKAKLGLSVSRDQLAEQEEELAQLEMMYKDADLADKTREIVLQRGKRRVKSAKERLECEARIREQRE